TSSVTRTTKSSDFVIYELHAVFLEQRRIRIESSSVARCIVLQRMPAVAIFSSGMISRYKKMCGN
ncbi:hypothetical protein LINPERHAP1_LOCUS31509, partial [Linum perenne]